MVKLLHMSSFSWRPQLIYIWILFLAVKLLSCDVPLVIILFVVAIVLVVLLLASISVYLLHTLNIAFTVGEWAPLIHLILTATQISVGGYLPSVSDTRKMLMQTLESRGTDFPFTLWLTTYSSAVCHWPCNSQCWFNLDTIFSTGSIYFSVNMCCWIRGEYQRTGLEWPCVPWVRPIYSELKMAICALEEHCFRKSNCNISLCVMLSTVVTVVA